MNYPVREYPASESRQTFPDEWLEQHPERNIAIIKAETMTDDQRFQEGFKDGQRRRGNRASLADYPEYQRGFSDGCKRRNEWQEEF